MSESAGRPPEAPSPPLPDESSRLIDELKRKVVDYERWFGVLDNQMRVLERERQKLAAVVNHSDAGFFVVNASLRVIWANEVFRQTSPLDASRIQGAGCNEALCRRDQICDLCPAAAPFRTGRVAHHELRLEREGGERHIYATSVPILSPSAVIEETLVMLQDVTDLSVLRRSQDALRASEERFRSIFQQASAGMATIAPDGSFLQVNPALCNLLGYSEAELTQRNVEGVTFPPDRAETLKILDDGASARIRQMTTEKRYQRKDGEIVWGEVSAAWVANSDGQPAYSIALIQDITERRQAQQGLRLEKELVQLLLDTATETNESGSVHEAIQTCLDRVCAFTGWPVGHGFLIASDGTGQLVSSGTWHIDDTERFEVFQRITAATHCHPGIGLPGRVFSTGRPEWIPDLTRDVNCPRARCGEEIVVRAGCAFPILVGKEVAGVLEFFAAEPLDADHRLLEVMGHMGAQLGRVFERQQAADALKTSEEQLRQAQKMEAIGTLAGGVAHDFNNILTGILGHAQLLRGSASPGDRVYKTALTIEHAGRRAAELTQQLLGFARKGKHQNKPVDLRLSIKEVIGLLGHTIDKRIRMTRSSPPDCPCALGDPVQLQQVILNLAVNARDAMAQGGEIRFTLETVLLGEAECQRRPGAAPGNYVVLSVEDTGSGIPAELHGRVFEPFFTTKEPGKGTGMGLAMVYGIVKNHHGFIELQSGVREGTTIRVFLPVAVGVPENDAVIAAAARNGSGRILVVDDEEIIREIASDFLTHLGYTVMTATDGQDAVDRYTLVGGSGIDLVIIDMMMPRMGGRDCFRALRKINPSIRAIVSSGYGLNEAVQEILDDGAISFVQKPYALDQFSQAVETALLEAARTSG